ncbi:unnamed protein product [Lasius platythorax]|uniref:Gustatory receptor n=1 Tax=Lasius platythorax TaxID=488582 RepID=A0AAV2NDI0_9HYME
MTQEMKDEITLQVEDNKPSMEHYRTHSMFVSWFLNVITRPPKCSKAITILHIIHIVICFVIVACDAPKYFTYISDLDNFYKSAINKIMFYVIRVMCCVSMLYYGYHNIKQYEKWPKLMSKMKNLDQQISKETPMNDRPIKIVEVLVNLATLGALLLIITVYFFFTHLEKDNTLLIRYYTLAQSLINSFIFDVIVYVLYHRFQTINKLIMQLDKQFNAPLITSKIRCIRRLHNEIYDVVIMVNDIHGFHLLLFSVYCIIMVVAALQYIYICVAENYYVFMPLNNITWILCTAQFGVTCWICTLVCQESENTGVIISTIALNCSDVNLDNQNGTRNQSNVEVPSKNQDSEQNSNRSSSNNENRDVLKNLPCKYLDRDHVKKEIDNFWIQSQQHRVVITACNFFEMNNALFTGFVGVIINYLIILIQCYEPDRTQKLPEDFQILRSDVQKIPAIQNETEK